MIEKFMIGTKFYRHIGNTEVPEIIRLKKQEGNVLYFNNGAYEATTTNGEFKQLISDSELINIDDKKFYRIFDYFGTQVKQVWKMINEPEDRFIKFKVENIGLKMSIQELKKNYIRLIPDGFFTISNISYPINDGNDRGFDVFCTLHEWNEKIPKVICRQDVIDVFAYRSDSKYINIGISISRDACPNNMDFQNFMYSEKVTNFKAVAVYLDDSINTILKYVGPLNKYNATMKKLEEKYRYSKMVGCQNNVYDLLINNAFYEDFKQMFEIFTYPFAIDLSRSEMNERETNILNSIVKLKNKKRLTNLIYCPYDKGIDMSKLDTSYLLINTGNNTNSDVYIVSYETVDIIE